MEDPDTSSSQVFRLISQGSNTENSKQTGVEGAARVCQICPPPNSIYSVNFAFKSMFLLYFLFDYCKLPWASVAYREKVAYKPFK